MERTQRSTEATRRRARKSAGKDAIAVLKADHRQVEGWFSQFKKSRSTERKGELARKICGALRVHTTIEEEIFYPAFKEAGQKSDDDKMYFEALEEHRAAGDLVLPDLLNTEVTSEKFSGRAKVLKELVEHHADEEEKEMFPRAKKLLSRDELSELGERLRQRKAELLSQARASR
jgi:hemerythrin superfamily protein